MNNSAIRTGALLTAATLGLTFASGNLRAQTSLPATAPTTTPSQLPSANPPVAHGDADIRWDGHLLTVIANGDSLPEVFAAVAARAGIHVTGAAPFDHVYGTFGPAPLVEVLSELVDGLSVNMLFVDQMGTKPAQLTFSPRTGAATPPDPSQQQQAQQQYAQQPASTFPGAQPSNAITPAGGTLPANAGAPGAAAQTGESGTNATSPNGVKTPQEIFEQLQRLRATQGAH